VDDIFLKIKLLLMKKINHFFGVVKKAFQLFNEFNGLKLSAALSYYTVFSIGPLLVIIISLAGIFFGKKAVEGKVYGQISRLSGSDTALQIQQIIGNIQKNHHSVAGAIIGFIILLVGASGVFSEIQDSLNLMWSGSYKKRNQQKTSVLIFIKQRLWSFSLLGGMAFILMVSLIVNSLIDLLSDKLKNYFPDYVVNLFYVLNIVVILLIITSLFAMIFKILPNSGMRWKDAFRGGFFTAILFVIGKLIIGIYLGSSKIGVTYGTAASVIIIMLWVYYSSIILYFGAAYMQIYLQENHKPGSIDKKPELQKNY
jgi:membrane protein